MNVRRVTQSMPVAFVIMFISGVTGGSIGAVVIIWIVRNWL